MGSAWIRHLVAPHRPNLVDPVGPTGETILPDLRLALFAACGLLLTVGSSLGVAPADGAGAGTDSRIPFLAWGVSTTWITWRRPAWVRRFLTLDVVWLGALAAGGGIPAAAAAPGLLAITVLAATTSDDPAPLAVLPAVVLAGLAATGGLGPADGLIWTVASLLVGALATAARHTVGRQLRRQAAFARFAQECFSDTLSWSSSLILDALVRNLSAGIGLRATVLQLDEAGRHVIAAASCTPGDPWVIHPLEFCQIGLVDWPDALAVVGSRVERAYMQPYELPRLPSILLRQLALPDALLLPLTGGDRVLGLIMIDHQRRRRPFAADEAAFARALGAQAGRLLTSADASRNSLTRSQQLAALYQLSLELMTQIERSRLYGAIVSAAVNLVGATAGFLVLSRPDEGRQLWATGIDEEALAGNPGRSLVELAHQCTVSAEARWQRLAGSWGALGAVPLEWDGAIIGALAVLSPAGSAPPGAAERELLRRVATQAAAAIAGVTRRGESAEAETQRRVGLVLDDVVSTICHELRAPLGLIRGYAETLLRRDRPPSDPWRTEFLDGIVRAASRMADILSDLASTRLGDAGTVLLQIEDVPLRDIVDQGLASVRDSARMRHQLLMEVPADAVVRVDRRQVERVVANLLGNAVKYSPAGTTIRVAAVRGAATVQLTVADEGIGIAPEDAPHLFEKFYRGRTVARIAPDGLGIGLYLCKRIVDAHGGTIVVERGPTGGTIVSVTLPGGRQIEGQAESE